MKPKHRRSPRSALTLLELIVSVALVLGSIVAVMLWVHLAREAAAEEYRTGFVRGILFAVREGDTGGILCGDASREMDGFHDARLLVGRELSPEMEIGKRVEIAEDVICRGTTHDVELKDRTLAALRDYGD